jgi:hypothetical protein
MPRMATVRPLSLAQRTIVLASVIDMSQLLEKAIREVSKLPESEQDALAQILLQELAAEDRWSKTFAKSESLLEQMAIEALAEHAAGKTKPLL